MKEKQYKAFISYSNKDEKFGKWLHKALEKYKIPKGLREDYPDLPKSLFPIFRDREELPTSDNLGKEILKGLKNSEYLIIICSVNSGKSQWVNREIIDFKNIHGEEKVRAIILDGEPHAKDNDKFSDDLECFPEALKYKVVDGKLSDIPTEPIAGDFRKGKDDKELGKLKLLAGLLEVNFDDLNQREEKRKRRNRWITTIITVITIIIISLLAIYSFWQKNIAEKSTKTLQNTLNKNLLIEALQFRDNNEILKFKHLLAKIIGKSSEIKSKDIKFMYMDSPYYLGKIIEYSDSNLTAYKDIQYHQTLWDKGELFRLDSDSPFKYIENGYSIEVSYETTDFYDFKYKFKKGDFKRTYTWSGCSFSKKPIIISDLNIIILYGLNGGSGNEGCTVRFFSLITGEQINNYDNDYNLNDVFLTEDKDFFISYSNNQLNISKLEKENIFTKKFDMLIHGAIYLKNNIILYWFENKITIIKIFEDTSYTKILEINNLSQISLVSFDIKDNTLTIMDKSTRTKRDISMIFKENHRDIISLYNESSRGFETELFEDSKENSWHYYYPEYSKVENKNLKVLKDQVTYLNTKKNITYYLKHNLMKNRNELESLAGYRTKGEITFAKVSKNKEKLLSWSCFSFKDTHGYPFCKLYLTDIKRGIHLLKKMETNIANVSFLKGDKGIAIEYLNSDSKIYEYKPINLKNEFFLLKTEVDTATKYLESGELRVLTPKEWLAKQVQYDKLIKE